ncbi:MAG: hypothetical protein HY816_05430 [Candidatus Wallbacteria bacterium]|nr:hypothetical protein [Candidatus Wallbacteria bacterium]
MSRLEIEALYRAFVLFEEVQLAAQSVPALSRAARVVELEARQMALAGWDALFGAEELKSAAHRGYLLRWCLKGLSALAESGVLSKQDWLATSRKLASDWESLGRPQAAHEFDKLGGTGPGIDACRRLYLLHRMYLELDDMAVDGLIPEQAREASLENLRLRTPRYWQALIPEVERERARAAGLAAACETVRDLGAAGKLDGGDVTSLLLLLGAEAREQGAGEAGPAGGEAPASRAAPRENAEAPGASEAGAARESIAAGPASIGTGDGQPGPVPGDATEGTGRPGSGDGPEGAALLGLAREIRLLERVELPLRRAATSLPPRLRSVLLTSVTETREKRWRELLGGEGASEDALTPELAQAVREVLERRVRGADLELAMGSLRGLGQDAGPAAEAAVGGPSMAPGPDPSSFDPAFAPDLRAFAAFQEQVERARRAEAPAVRRVRVALPQPPQKARSYSLDPGGAIPALLGELSIHWLLFLGAFLVLGGGLILTFSLWSDASGAGRYMPLLLTTAFFHGLAMLVEQVFGLKRSAGALSGIALLFLPLNALAIRWLGLWSEASGVAAGAMGGLLLLALSVPAARRTLAPAAGAGELGARLWLASALTAIWPPGLTNGLPAAVAGLACVMLLLVPGLGRLGGEGGRPAPSSIGFAGLLALAAHSAFCLASYTSAGPLGLLLIGAMHVADAAAVALRQLRSGEDPGDLPALFGGAARVFMAAAALCLIIPGIPGNRWLIAGLLYAAYSSGRAYHAERGDQQLAETFALGLAAELLFVYADPAVFGLWHPVAEALLGVGGPGWIVPQLAVGAACTVAGALTAGRDRRVSVAFHGLGALTALLGAVLAVPAGGRGLVIGGAILAFHGAMAVASRHAYMAVVAVWAALTVVAEALVLTGATAPVWGMTGVACCWALAALGRMGGDDALSRMDPLLVPGVTLTGCATPLAWVAGFAMLVGLTQGEGPWSSLASFVLLVAFFAHSELLAGSSGGPLASQFWLVVTFLHCFGMVAGQKSGVNVSVALSGLFAVALAAVGFAAALEGRNASVAFGFHAFGAALGATLAGAGAAERAHWAPCLVMASYGVLAFVLQFAYPAFVATWAGLALTGGLLGAAQAHRSTWYIAWIAWLYALAIGGEAGVDARLARMRRLLVGELTLSGAAMPLAWLTAVSLAPQSFGRSDQPWTTAASIGFLSLFFAYRAVRGADEPAAWASVLGPFLAYGHLKVNGILPDSPLVQLLAIVSSYPLLVLARALSGPLAVFRSPLRHTALALPMLVAGAGLYLWEGTWQATMVGAAAVFYNLVPMAGEARAWFYAAGLLYNLANFLFWRPYHLSTALLWTLPAGLTLIAFTHANRDELSSETRSNLRAAGTLLISGESLWGAVAHAQPSHALVLAFLAVVGVLAGLHFRVKDYLIYSTLLLVIDVGSFVVRQVLAFSGYGVGSLIAGGLALIALAAVFERGRTTLMAKLETWRRRMEGWD